ncbi:MAG: transporter [Methylocystis sp.]|nr:transporter [Methylocystis sp.]MCA3583869.1 transporter [Methylocystis sp.]MCA3589653.1 transporter [Methylocystis sp.]MCA3593171.1 transporter [Methylocystis sp.]
MRSSFNKILLSSASVALLALGSTGALAGGFASRQQSVTGQGFSFAGAGTSAFGIGSNFWNPANITNFEGRRSEYNINLVLPNTSMTADRLTNSTGAVNLFGPAANVPRIGSGNINQGTVTLSGHNSFQVNDWLWLGTQSGFPFGSRTKAAQGFSGSMYGTSTVVRAFALTPSFAIKANDWLAFGFGLTGQRLNVTLNSGSPGAPALAGIPTTSIYGDGYGLGWTAGVTLKPFQGTEISLGYRSMINHQLDGGFDQSSATGQPLSQRLVKVNVNLPEIATLGVAQRINDQWTVTGTVQWTNWSRLGVAPLLDRTTSVPITGLGFKYRDEWFYALGAQYQLNNAWKLRAGLAYEVSPIDNENRGVRVLDSNRFWLSLGAGYKWSEKLEFDIAYSHLFLQSGQVNIVPAGSPFNPGGNPAFDPRLPQFNGSSKGAIDIVSVSLKYRWDDPSPSAAPLTKKY